MTEKTPEKLLRAAGEIMAEKGHRAINATTLGFRINRHRTAVKNHFGNMKGFLEAYVRLTDSWKPSLEAYTLPETASREEIKATCIALMQSNFDSFTSDREMQHIILWQASEEHPLMKRISAEREKAAEPLLALAAPYFEGTGINFRAVMCAALSTVYYPTWHARFTKGTAAGLDINKEADYRDLRETIGFLIEWAWEQAERRAL